VGRVGDLSFGFGLRAFGVLDVAGGVGGLGDLFFGFGLTPFGDFLDGLVTFFSGCLRRITFPAGLKS
jgi:hypothetical protein